MKKPTRKLKNNDVSLFGESLNRSSFDKPKPLKLGPPNRMNDLDYSTWMKFQKSFFRWEDTLNFAVECIHFFTKAIWPDGKPGRILLIGDEDLLAVQGRVGRPRQIDFEPASSISKSLEILREKETSSCDFVLISLLTAKRWNYDKWIKRAYEVCAQLSRVLRPEKYCSVILPSLDSRIVALPMAWTWAASGRGILRLRDEKVGIRDPNEEPIYCLFLQSCTDKIAPLVLASNEVACKKSKFEFPTWIIPKPPPRKPGEILHPAKFPETLIEQFIKLFTKEGDIVLDPMTGTGSALVAAKGIGRDSVGVELDPTFSNIARNRLQTDTTVLFEEARIPKSEMVTGDARDLIKITGLKAKSVDYCITSPPYWSMLQNRGSEYQRGRRIQGLRTTYSESDRDIGNISDYTDFLGVLEEIYNIVAYVLRENCVLTLVVKNVKRNHIVYPLAWDLVLRLCSLKGKFSFLGCTLWCQDDIGLKPFAVGTHWVSNTLHQYCLHFQKRG